MRRLLFNRFLAISGAVESELLYIMEIWYFQGGEDKILGVVWWLVTNVADNLKMEAARSSETLVYNHRST